MSRSLAAPQPLLRTLLQGRPRAQQQCQRFLSTHQPSPSSYTSSSSFSSSRRPTTCAPSQPKQRRPLEQRRYKAKTVEEARSRYRTGPFSWKAGLLFVATSGALVWYFEHEKARMQRKRVAEAAKGVGRPKVGGEFVLLDQDGRTFTSEDLKGRYSLVRLLSLYLPTLQSLFFYDCLDNRMRIVD